ncbi:response regulator [Desulfococcaceae bacterium HSG8]|nr:response regulator [Desulfococcaceae bacterium HSG8]
MRVILVDDEEELISALAERLSFRGIEADWATNAEETETLVSENQYDLAVLDVKMPKTSGLDLKRILQKIAPSMKYIFLTGHGSGKDFEAGAAEAGANYYLVKPVKIEDLVEKMKEAVGK